VFLGQRGLIVTCGQLDFEPGLAGIGANVALVPPQSAAFLPKVAGLAANICEPLILGLIGST